MSKRSDGRKGADRKNAARVVREQIAREQRRRQQLWTGVAAVVLLLVAGLTSWFVYSSQHDTKGATPKNLYQGIGYAEGSGPKLVEVFSDYQCPVCKNFMSTVAPTLEEQVKQKKIKLVHYPLSILNQYSTNQYSTRSAAALGCAADLGKFKEYDAMLWKKQPDENSAGPSNDDLAGLGKSIGLGSDFKQCVTDLKFEPWTKRVNDEGDKRKIHGTPTVYLNGKRMGKDQGTIQDTLDDLYKGLGIENPAANANPTAAAGASAAPTASATTAPSESAPAPSPTQQ